MRDETDARLPPAARFALMAVVDQIDAPAGQIDRLERSIVTEAKRDEDMRRLTTIPGVGAITAATIKSLVPDPGGFKSGHHFVRTAFKARKCDEPLVSRTSSRPAVMRRTQRPYI